MIFGEEKLKRHTCASGTCARGKGASGAGIVSILCEAILSIHWEIASKERRLAMTK